MLKIALIWSEIALLMAAMWSCIYAVLCWYTAKSTGSDVLQKKATKWTKVTISAALFLVVLYSAGHFYHLDWW